MTKPVSSSFPPFSCISSFIFFYFVKPGPASNGVVVVKGKTFRGQMKGTDWIRGKKKRQCERNNHAVCRRVAAAACLLKIGQPTSTTLQYFWSAPISATIQVRRLNFLMNHPAGASRRRRATPPSKRKILTNKVTRRLISPTFTIRHPHHPPVPATPPVFWRRLYEKTKKQNEALLTLQKANTT